MPGSIGHDVKYFQERHVLLDQRGTLTIDPESHWGSFITTITWSHSVENWDTIGMQATTLDRPVIVERGAWICSGVLLYNCRIGEGAVVAAGTVVRSQDVAPYVIVAGNPARVIARYYNNQWNYLGEKWEILT